MIEYRPSVVDFLPIPEAHTDTTTTADRTPPAALTEGRPTPNPY